MPLRIFGSRALSGANLIQALMACAMFGTFFLGSLYLQRVQGYGPLRIGLAFLPVTVLMGIVSIRYAERLSTRFGARNLVVPGIVLILAGLVWFTQAPAGGSYAVHVLPVMVLVGLGGGVCFPAVMNLGMTGVTHDDAGLASGLLSTTAQVGGALGLAVLATVSAGHGNHLLAAGRPAAIALTGGYHVAFWIAAAVAAMAAVIAATMLRSGSEHR
jgi:MFS family permease